MDLIKNVCKDKVLLRFFQLQYIFLQYMIKSNFKVIGCMSGTSLDGLDLAYIEFSFDKTWSFNIIHTETIKYSTKWHNTLKNLVLHQQSELKEVDNQYTTYLGKAINNFVSQNHINEIDAICSHGHTALHQPEIGMTYQIGNQDFLSELVGKIVVCDFRTQDVQLGGQGAPLVPIGDELLFSNYDYCINLGGFANISTQLNSKRIAYDICPVNIVLNHYVSKLGFQFDNNGEIATTGKVEEKLFDELNQLQYYHLKPPKSLGLEWVRKNIFPVIDKHNLEIKDVLRTFVEHSVFQIAKQISQSEKSKALITGGGAYNTFLINRLKKHTQCEIIIPSKDLIEYKEALIFGLLGVLKLRGENNCLSSVTGATQDHSSGNIYYP